MRMFVSLLKSLPLKSLPSAAATLLALTAVAAAPGLPDQAGAHHSAVPARRHERHRQRMVGTF